MSNEYSSCNQSLRKLKCPILPNSISFNPNLFDVNPSLFDVAMKPNAVPIWLVTRLDNGDYFINYDNPMLSERPKYCPRFTRGDMKKVFNMRYKDGIIPFNRTEWLTGKYDVITLSGEPVSKLTVSKKPSHLVGQTIDVGHTGFIGDTFTAWYCDGKYSIVNPCHPKDLLLKRKDENVPVNADELIIDNGNIKIILNGNNLNIVHDGSFDIKVSGK